MAELIVWYDCFVLLAWCPEYSVILVANSSYRNASDWI